ncbi:hypothetical protein VTP01DRAFT_1780 [Rhizomucor pusillus]|uniref:uncharacterized protein n=1 Tax=Rhizomucor pusillus TaxID=4840 RepID=UPI003742E139
MPTLTDSRPNDTIQGLTAANVSSTTGREAEVLQECNVIAGWYGYAVTTMSSSFRHLYLQCYRGKIFCNDHNLNAATVKAKRDSKSRTFIDTAYDDLQIDVRTGVMESAASSARRNHRHLTGARKKHGHRADFMAEGEHGGGVEVSKNEGHEDQLTASYPQHCQQLAVVGFIMMGLKIRVFVLDRPSSYICRLQGTSPLYFPSTEEILASPPQLGETLTLIIHERAVRRFHNYQGRQRALEEAINILINGGKRHEKKAKKERERLQNPSNVQSLSTIAQSADRPFPLISAERSTIGGECTISRWTKAKSVVNNKGG